MNARSSTGPAILDVRGEPLRPSKTLMLAPGGNAPYDAADIYGQNVATWRPYLYSPDGEINLYRDRIVARVRDLVRNDGWASGAVTRILDNAIGGRYRPMFRPDYRALAAYSGNAAFDADWANDFARVAEANYRTWANDPNKYADAQRALNIPQLMRLAFRHKLIDGDALAQIQWLPERLGPGRARYATAVQLIDPDRLSNPQLRFDQRSERGGVAVDEHGAAIGYHIRRAHQGDWWAAADSVTWDYVERETPWGRPIIVHDFDHDRAAQHRGGAGIFTPILQRMRMLSKMDSIELDAALVNSLFGAYLESPFDPQLMEQAVADTVCLPPYQQQRTDFHNERRTMLGELKVPILFPGEKINAVKAERPNANFAQFEKTFLRNFAAATGLSTQQMSHDWSDTNYSSARGALLEAYKTLRRRQLDFSFGFAQPVVSAWLEESMEVDDYPLPANAPPFLECRAMYGRADWMGPARGWIDPVAEKQGAILGMDASLSTLQIECMEQDLDWEDVIDQRKRELDTYEACGLTPPSWAGLMAGSMQAPSEREEKTAMQVVKPPEPV